MGRALSALPLPRRGAPSLLLLSLLSAVLGCPRRFLALGWLVRLSVTGRRRRSPTARTLRRFAVVHPRHSVCGHPRSKASAKNAV